MDKWTTGDRSPLFGKIALITNGIEGAGLEVARELYHQGARIILCTEDVTRGETAIRNIRSVQSSGEVSYEQVDFADLNSVKYFADRLLLEHEKLDILINNAEVSELPARINSSQNHEMMLARNFLAPFVLTARLFPLLENSEDGRIIFESSAEDSSGVIDFFDLDATHYYESKKAYAQSKLAILMFAKELDRRLKETHLSIKSIPVQRAANDLVSRILRIAVKPSFEAEASALIFAATSQDAISGHYYGGRGRIHELDTPLQAKNIHAAEKLWSVGEEIGGVEFNLTDMSNILPFQMRGNILPELFT